VLKVILIVQCMYSNELLLIADVVNTVAIVLVSH
jgi:hypothetical protein